MRFRKTISICKGVKMNVSKSGMSFTVGGKGLSLNLGSKGVFLNTSIPGTGLYDRHKLFGGSNSSKKSGKSRAEEIDVNDFELVLEEDGSVEILQRDGGRVTEAEARAIRKTDWYREESEALTEKFREELEAESDVFLTLHHYAQSVPDRGGIEDSETVEKVIDTWLSELELPVEFEVQYEYDSMSGSVMMDLDLPEIEDLPERKAVELASGAVKAKDKTQRELRDEYRTCVLGLAVFFASNVFLASEGIGEVMVSGYTQRRDKRTGEREDCYIYSIIFEREAFRSGKCAKEDPSDFCDRFRSRINVLASGEMKEIVPYTPAEFLGTEE